MATLTDKQRAILDFIVKRQRARQSPTLAEIADEFGMASNSGPVPHLQALQRKGYVTWKPAIPRSIEVLDTGRAETIWGSFPIGA